jgi:hypothetical protein
MRWRFSAPAGDVEGSKLCLFSVIMPAKCVSSVSPRFHYRRLAFCFLPLAAILESTLHLLKPIKGKYIFLGGNEFVFHACTYIGKSFHSSILFVLQGSELFVE